MLKRWKIFFVRQEKRFDWESRDKIKGAGIEGKAQTPVESFRLMRRMPAAMMRAKKSRWSILKNRLITLA